MIWLILWALGGLIPFGRSIYNSGRLEIVDLVVLAPICAIIGPFFPLLVLVKVFLDWDSRDDVLRKTIWQKRR